LVVGGKFLCSSQTGCEQAKGQGQLANQRLSPDSCRRRVRRLPSLPDRTFVPIVPVRATQAASANLNSTQPFARRIHAYPFPFLRCRKPVLARIRRRSGPGGQG